MAAEICRWEKEIALKSERNHQSTGTAVLTLAAAAVLLAVDQILKYFVVQSLKPVNAVTVIPGLLELVYVENTGAAFGLFKSVMWLVVAVTVVATAAIAVMLFRYKRHSFLSYATSALLISGGIAKLKSLFRGNKSRSEVVATFLSVLELCKIHSISLNQDEHNEYRVSYLKMPDESEVRE